MSILFDREGAPTTPGCPYCGRRDNPDHNPDHDSLYTRFEQLEGRLVDLMNNVPTDVKWRVGGAMALVQLIRSQVLK